MSDAHYGSDTDVKTRSQMTMEATEVNRMAAPSRVFDRHHRAEEQPADRQEACQHAIHPSSLALCMGAT